MPPWAAMECARRGAVVVREDLDVVALLAQGGGGRGAGQAGAHDDDLEPAAVVGRHQLHVELVAGPAAPRGAVGDLAVECADHVRPPSWYSSHDSIRRPRLRSRVVVGAHDADEHGDREAQVAHHDDGGEGRGEDAPPRVPPGLLRPEALEQRPGPVEQVQAQGDVGDDVDERHHRPLEAGDQVAVHVAPHEVGVDGAPREVGQVEQTRNSRTTTPVSASTGWRRWPPGSRGARRSRPPPGPGGS